MEDEQYKQIMFSKTEGFWRIVYQLQGEIAFLWTEGNLDATFPRIKHLYAFVCSHFRKNDYDFIAKFKEIEKILYDPLNKKYSTFAKMKALRNFREADNLMFELYIKLKKLMKESDMELYYGTPKDIIIQQKQDANINKVFGRHKK